MKIRNPRIIRAAGWLGTVVAKALVRSLRFEYVALGETVMPPQPEPAPRSIYLLWHETLLLPLTKYACPEVSTLVSRHADGQILATLIQQLGLSVVSGSTNRGGVQAVRDIIRDVTGCRHLAITPDGPRGPRRMMQTGGIYLSAKTGMTLSPLGVAYRKPWRAKSWDRFAIPTPCSRARVVSGRTFRIPAKVRTEDLESYAVQVKAELDRLTVIAEHWAETNELTAAIARADAMAMVPKTAWPIETPPARVGSP